MNLNNFEKVVETKILDRGISYYKGDSVEELEMIDKNEFSATVLGSEEYQVYVKLSKNQEILYHSCDCPYDWGNVCKHEVAVFYYLRDIGFEPDDFENSPFQKLKKGLGKLSKKELLELLIDLSKRNPTVRMELKDDLRI